MIDRIIKLFPKDYQEILMSYPSPREEKIMKITFYTGVIAGLIASILVGIFGFIITQ